MQLEKLTLYRLNMELNEPFVTSFGIVKNKDFFVIELEDRIGNRGYGESVAFTAPWYTEETTETIFHMMDQFLVPLLKDGKITHPDDVMELFSPIKRNRMAKAAIEGAVWDLYAKQKNIPLAKALGGNKVEVPVGISLGMEKNTTELLKKIEKYISAGYKRIKVKIARNNDLAVLRAIRKVYPNLPLMVDANSAYTVEDIDYLRRFDEFGLMMIEQPLGADDIIDHAALQAKLETPICLDESIYSLEDVKLAVQLGSCKIINIKSGRVGGLSEARKIHHFCKQNGVQVWCGGMLDAGIGRAHNIALSSLDNFTLPGDIGASSRYWKRDIINPEIVVDDGMISVSDEPGIGYKIDRQALKMFTVWQKDYTLT